MPDPNDKPGGIYLAAIVLALMGVFGLLTLAFSIVTLFLARHAIAPTIPSVRVALALVHLLLLTAVAWCFCTVVGLFRFRKWARYSIMVLGILDFLFFLALSASLAWLHGNPFVTAMDARPHPSMPFSPGALMLGLSAFYALLALIGVWWVVYFNLARVRDCFSSRHRV